MNDAKTGNPVRTGHYAMGAPSLGGRLISVIIVAACSFIPLIIVGFVLDLRADYARQTVAGLEASVGGRQGVFGPVVIVPVTWTEGASVVRVLSDGSTVTETRAAPEPYVFVPEAASYDLALATSTVEASVYSAVAYEAELGIKVEFDFSNHPPLAEGQSFDFSGATLVHYLGTTSSARFRPELIIGEDRIPLYASLGIGTALDPGLSRSYRNAGKAGFSAVIGEKIDPTTPLTLSTAMTFGGATSLNLAPVGRNTAIRFAADAVPTSLQNFKADALTRFSPDVVQETGSAGPYSTLPQSLFSRDLGDRLLARQQWEVVFESADARPYEDLFRALRYGFFLLGFSFLTLFIFDASSSKTLHAGQYFLLGLIQSVFYAFLLAVAEFTGFAAGFLIAAVPTVIVTGYTIASALGSMVRGIVGFIVFGVFYAVQYFLMDRAEYSLLVATGAAFAAIAVALMVTARLDWNSLGNND